MGRPRCAIGTNCSARLPPTRAVVNSRIGDTTPCLDCRLFTRHGRNPDLHKVAQCFGGERGRNETSRTAGGPVALCRESMRQHTFLGVAAGAMTCLAVAAPACRLRRRYVSVTVRGESMEPTLRHGDRLLADRTRIGDIRVGDVVVLEPGRPRPVRNSRPSTAEPAYWMIKRVVACPAIRCRPVPCRRGMPHRTPSSRGGGSSSSATMPRPATIPASSATSTLNKSSESRGCHDAASPHHAVRASLRDSPSVRRA